MDDSAQEINNLESSYWARAELNWNTGRRHLCYKHNNSNTEEQGTLRND